MGTEYTRQSTYTDGDTITAAHTNDEFDRILAVFEAGTGHTHDGTANEGGPISKLLSNGLTFGSGADSDITIAFDTSGSDGELKWMHDDDRFQFSDDIMIVDNEQLIFGTNSDVAISYDETTTDSLKIAATEGAGLAITLMADEGDDAGDEWKLNIADGGTLTLGNDINSAGTYVTHLTITPNSTVANSTMAVAGNIDVDGTANLDAVDIDGAVQIDGTVTVGANDQGYDVILYGDTASANVTWDTSADDLIFNGAAGLIIPDGQLTLGSTAVASTATELNLLDGSSANSVVNSKAVIYGSSGELAGTLSTAAQANITSVGTLTTLTIDDILVDGKVITLTGSSGDTATITASANGALDIATTDAAGAAGNIQITADGTAELAGTTVTLDSEGGITLDANGGTITFADNGSSLGTVTSSGFTGNVVGNVTGNVSGTAGSATGSAATLATPRAIGGVNFDGSAAINLPGVNTAGNQNTSGTAAIATEVTATANNTTAETVYLAFVDGATGAQGIETDTGLTWNPNTNVLTAANVAGALTGNVTGNASGTAATVTTAAQPNITSLGTLTTLTVDNVIINGTTIGHTGDTDLITVADSLLTIAGDVTITGTTPTLTIGDAGEEDAKIVFDGNAQDFHIGLDDTADDLVIGLGSAVGTTPALSIDENVLVTVADDIKVVGRATSSTLTTHNMLLGDGSTNEAVNLALGNNFVSTTTANSTVFTFASPAIGQSGTIMFVNAGNHTVSMHASVNISAASLAVLQVTGTYKVSYFCKAASGDDTIFLSVSQALV
jgi:hypothetical protein